MRLFDPSQFVDLRDPASLPRRDRRKRKIRVRGSMRPAEMLDLAQARAELRKKK